MPSGDISLGSEDFFQRFENDELDFNWILFINAEEHRKLIYGAVSQSCKQKRQ